MVLFNRFGDTSVQEAVNLESFQRLSNYCEHYVELIGEPGQYYQFLILLLKLSQENILRNLTEKHSK